MGIQFEAIPGFTAIDTKEVHDLYKQDFPIVREQQRLAPHFETFGGNPPSTGPQISFGARPELSRLWFVSSTGEQIVQFQPDRLLANWRNNDANTLEYPRFKYLHKSFLKNAEILISHGKKKFSVDLKFNQVELSYTNIVPVEQFTEASKWFNFAGDTGLNLESLNINFNEISLDVKGNPTARLYYALNSVINPKNKQKAYSFSLNYKGKPEINDINSVSDFLKSGNEKIVTQFTKLTTSQAHASWKKL